MRSTPAVSGDPERRVWQHKNSDLEGFTKRCDIKRLVWYELHGNPTTAIEREKRLAEMEALAGTDVETLAGPTTVPATRAATTTSTP